MNGQIELRLPLELGDRAGFVRSVGSLRGYVPILHGFPLPAHASADPPSAAELGRLDQALFGDPEDYRAFARRKWRRPVADAYAAFQPFNESTQALFPLLPLLREVLRPGDQILDVWGRTGWTGELLAGLFPEQRVVSLWEGASDVLGMRGYRFWLGEGRRASNLDIVFHHPSAPLPFPSGSFGAVVALDCLHRYDVEVLPEEVVRVCRADGIALFPHVHLANGRPEPFFERGGLQLRGRAWSDRLNARLSASGRRAWVMAELDLFEGRQRTLNDNADTPRYNGFIAIGPAALDGAPLGPVALPEAASPWRLVINPLIELDLDGQRARLATGADARYVMDRHPAYERHLARQLPLELTSSQVQLLHIGARGSSLTDIAQRLQRPVSAIHREALAMQERGLIQLAPVSEAMARLHTFYRSQRCHEGDKEDTLPSLWRHTLARHGDAPYLIDAGDGGVITYAEADEVIAAIRERLDRARIPSRCIAVWAEPHVEAALTFWAAAFTGHPIAFLDPAWPSTRVSAVLERLRPGLVLVDAPRGGRLDSALGETVLLDGEGGGPGLRFADWLYQGESGGDASTAVPTPLSGSEGALDGRVAAILFTSGTSGEPKGVALRQGGLVRSARLVAEAWDLGPDDRLMSPGSFHAMSGLRNPIIATAAVGAAALLPGRAREHVVGAVEVARAYGVTTLSVVPAFLQRWTELCDRLPDGVPTLRRVLCTAASLDPNLKARVRAIIGAPIFDYYGLTETSGVCVLQLPEADSDRGELGRAEGVIAQLIDPEGAVIAGPGTGALRLYTDNAMAGYVGDAGATGVLLKDGWVYTGDRVRRFADGSLALVGRSREILKAPSGDRVGVGGVREVILGVEGVRDVHLTPFRDARGDERLAAELRLCGDRPEAQVIEAVRGALLERLGPGGVVSEIRAMAALGPDEGGGASVEASKLRPLDARGESEG